MRQKVRKTARGQWLGKGERGEEEAQRVEEERKRDGQLETAERWPHLLSPRSCETVKISRAHHECFGLLSQEAQNICQIVQSSGRLYSLGLAQGRSPGASSVRRDS